MSGRDININNANTAIASILPSMSMLKGVQILSNFHEADYRNILCCVHCCGKIDCDTAVYKPAGGSASVNLVHGHTSTHKHPVMVLILK